MCHNPDSFHEIAEDVELRGNARLHRFLNPANVPYSAVYFRGREVWSCERQHEGEMIKSWNSDDNSYVNGTMEHRGDKEVELPW